MNVKERLARFGWRILNYQNEVFATSVGEAYLAIFCPIASDGYDIYGGEWSTSQGYSIHFDADGSYWGKWDMFAHQTFHRWNGWAWGIGGLDSWFREGPNVLYEMKTVTELRIDRPYGDMVDELLGYTDTYFQDYVATGDDQPLTGGDLDSFLIYRKGAMVSFLIAREIYLRTGGEHTFDDFLQVLVQTYGHYAEPCSGECLETELAALTGTDFSQFFDDYVYGVTPLPMDWAFEDTDGDGLLNAQEIGWDTHPEQEDTDGDGYSDAEEVSKYSDPLDPLSIPHPVYVPLVSAPGYVPPALPIQIDGQGEDWQGYSPVATDAQGDTTGGPHTDLKAFYAEKGLNYVYVMVEVYDPPLLPEQATLELDWDVVRRDGTTWELDTNIGRDGWFGSWVDSDGDGGLEDYPISGAVTAWGNVMELRLPLAGLGYPSQAQPSFANLWCDVGGQWTWVDMINP